MLREVVKMQLWLDLVKPATILLDAHVNEPWQAPSGLS